MFILAVGEDSELRDEEGLNSYFNGILLSYKYSLGENSGFAFGDENTGLKLFYWVLATVVLAIIMLNMIIAVMGSAFSDANAMSTSIKYKAKAELVAFNIYIQG